MPVPIATVHKYNCAVFLEYHVGAARQLRGVQPETIAGTMKQGSEFEVPAGCLPLECGTCSSFFVLLKSDPPSVIYLYGIQDISDDFRDLFAQGMEELHYPPDDTWRSVSPENCNYPGMSEDAPLHEESGFGTVQDRSE